MTNKPLSRGFGIAKLKGMDKPGVISLSLMEDGSLSIGCDVTEEEKQKWLTEMNTWPDHLKGLMDEEDD